MGIWEMVQENFTRAKKLLLLGHVVTPIHPAVHMAKAATAVALTLLIDRYTKNPDSVTSTFNALLCITPTALLGWQAGLGIFVSSVIGSFWGLLMALIWSGGDWMGNFFGDLSSVDRWWLMFRIPLAIVLTMYTLFVLSRYDPGSLTSGLFSALYVQLIGQRWPYQPHWMHNKLIVSTALVRVLSIPIGVFSALVVNLITSIFLESWMFQRRFHFIEKQIHDTIDIIDEDPMSDAIQGLFQHLQNYRRDLTTALFEVRLRDKLFLCGKVSNDQRILEYGLGRSVASFNLLSGQAFLSQASRMESLSQEEMDFCKVLLRGSKRKDLGFDHKHLITDLPPNPQLDLVRKMIMFLISRFEAYETPRELAKIQRQRTKRSLELQTA